jgi:hypothetical protein
VRIYQNVVNKVIYTLVRPRSVHVWEPVKGGCRVARCPILLFPPCSKEISRPFIEPMYGIVYTLPRNNLAKSIRHLECLISDKRPPCTTSEETPLTTTKGQTQSLISSDFDRKLVERKHDLY